MPLNKIFNVSLFSRVAKVSFAAGRSKKVDLRLSSDERRGKQYLVDFNKY